MPSIESEQEHISYPTLIVVCSIRCQASVSELLWERRKVVGARLTDAVQIAAKQVIATTKRPVTAQLTGLHLPTEGVGCTCLYFAGDQPFHPQPSFFNPPLFPRKYLILSLIYREFLNLFSTNT